MKQSDMTVEIHVPVLGESVVEAEVASWLKREGDSVKQGEALVELMTDKTTFEVTAEQSGVLQKIFKQEGEIVAAGDVLGRIGEIVGKNAGAGTTSDQPQRELFLATLTQIITQKSQEQDSHAVRAFTASFKPYLDRFDKVKDAAEKGVSREHWNMQVNGAYVNTLFYSYNPSEVTFAAFRLRKKLNEIISGKGEGRRGTLVIAKDTLYGLARLLGYYNLYRYLSQVSPDKSDSRLLPMLCNLAIPTEQIIEQVDKADTTAYASSWLEEHLPPLGDAPNPCCFIPTRGAGMRSNQEDFLKYRSDYWMSQFRSPDWEPRNGKSYWISVGRDIAQEIIATEMSNLLDFRNSLYLFLAVLAPPTQDEHERSYDDPVVAVKTVTEENGRHCYHIELSDKTRFSGSRSFIVTVHDEGEIELSEDEIDG